MQKLILWMKLGTKSDLSWATIGHEHHDEAIRDAQAPAQASSEQPALVQAPASMSMLRHNCGAQLQVASKQRRAGAAVQRPARRSHAARASPRARTVVTGDAAAGVRAPSRIAFKLLES